MHPIDEAVQSRWRVGRKELLIVGSLVLVDFMSAFNSTVIPPALPSISRELHGDTTSTFWVGTAYLLPSAALQPFICTLSDSYSRRALLLISIFFFTVGSIAGAVSQNMPTLLAGRAIQGAGCGGLIPLPMIVTTDIFPLRERPKYTSIIQAFAALGLVLGPLIGGALSQHTAKGWRWIFYINIPLCVVAFVSLFFTLKLQRTSKGRPIDWLGGVLFIGSILSLLMALSWGGMLYAWSSVHTILPICIGVVGLILTMIWEKWGSESPFLRMSILSNLGSLCLFTGCILQGIMMSGVLYYGSFYFEAIKDLSPTTTGASILVVSATMIPFAMLTAHLISRFGKYTWSLWAGWVTATLGTGLICLFDLDTPTGVWGVILIIVGAGHGILFNALLFAAQSLSPAKDVAYAVALYTFFRTIGFAVGVVIGSAALQNITKHSLLDAGISQHLTEELTKNSASYAGILKASLKDEAFSKLITGAYMDGIRGIFKVLTGMGGLGLILTAFIPQVSMDQPIETEHELRPPRTSTREELA